MRRSPHVVAVSPHLVEIDEVGEQQTLLHLREMARAGGDAGGVVGGVIVHVDATLHEDLADLADADHGDAALRQVRYVGPGGSREKSRRRGVRA